MKVKKYYYIIIILLVILNIIFRFPIIPHELGADSFTIHTYGTQISTEGYAEWILSPLSYFGLFPYSYSSGVPFLISGVNQCTQLNMEFIIFILATIFGIFSIFTCLVMSNSICNDDYLDFLIAFGFSLSPIVLKFTVWTMSTRGLFIIALPLFIWSLLKGYSEGRFKWKYQCLSAVLFVFLASIHKLFLIVGIFWIVYFASIALHYIGKRCDFQKKWLTMQISGFIFVINLVIFAFILGDLNVPVFNFLANGYAWDILLSNKYIIFYFIILSIFLTIYFQILNKYDAFIVKIESLSLILLFLIVFLIQFTRLSLWKTFWWLGQITPEFIYNPSPQGQIFNFSFVLTSRIGFLLLFSIIGLLILMRTHRMDYKQTFFILLFLVVLFPIHVAMYFYQSAVVIFYIFAGFALIMMLNKIGNSDINMVKFLPKLPINNLILIIVCTVMFVSLVFSGYTLANRYNNIYLEGAALTDASYNAAHFVKSYNPSITVKGQRANQISAIIGKTSLLNKDELDIIQRDKPNKFTDLQGWYSYIKEPFIVERQETTPLNFFIYSTNKELSEDSYIIFDNGERNIWYK